MKFQLNKLHKLDKDHCNAPWNIFSWRYPGCSGLNWASKNQTFKIPPKKFLHLRKLINHQIHKCKWKKYNKNCYCTIYIKNIWLIIWTLCFIPRCSQKYNSNYNSSYQMLNAFCFEFFISKLINNGTMEQRYHNFKYVGFDFFSWNWVFKLFTVGCIFPMVVVSLLH